MTRSEFDTWIEQHYDDLLKVARRRTNNDEDAADVDRQWFVCGEIMMKLRRNKKIDPNRIRGLLADILIAVSVRHAGAVLITKNEKDFKLIQELHDFKYITVA